MLLVLIAATGEAAAQQPSGPVILRVRESVPAYAAPTMFPLDSRPVRNESIAVPSPTPRAEPPATKRKFGLSFGSWLKALCARLRPQRTCAPMQTSGLYPTAPAAGRFGIGDPLAWPPAHGLGPSPAPQPASPRDTGTPNLGVPATPDMVPTTYREAPNPVLIPLTQESFARELKPIPTVRRAEPVRLPTLVTVADLRNGPLPSSDVTTEQAEATSQAAMIIATASGPLFKNSVGDGADADALEHQVKSSTRSRSAATSMFEASTHARLGKWVWLTALLGVVLLILGLKSILNALYFQPLSTRSALDDSDAPSAD